MKPIFRDGCVKLEKSPLNTSDGLKLLKVPQQICRVSLPASQWDLQLLSNSSGDN